MDDVYEINVAKARLREAYNAGNVDLLLTAFADEFTDMSSGKPSFFGADAKSVFRMRMTSLFKQHQATLIVTIIAIRVFATAAFDYGWHSLTLTPRERWRVDNHPKEIFRDLAENLQQGVEDQSLH